MMQRATKAEAESITKKKVKWKLEEPESSAKEAPMRKRKQQWGLFVVLAALLAYDEILLDIWLKS